MENTHDLVYLMEGGWEIWEENSCYRLEAGDMIFLHAGRRHFGKTGCLPGTRTMFIHFDKLKEDSISSQNQVYGWDDTVLIDSVTHCQNNPRVMELCKDIICNFFSGAPYIQIKLFAQLIELLYELSTMSLKSKNGLVEDELVRETIFRIGTTPSKNYTVQSLADDLYICASTLSKRFKKATGMSIYQYQLNTKLEMARTAILNDQNLSLKEIAAVFGFCDEFHFSKLFKKIYGLSPSQFRRKSLVVSRAEDAPICGGILRGEAVYRTKLHALLGTAPSARPRPEEQPHTQPGPQNGSPANNPATSGGVA